MHLVERYSLSCGVKIKKPFILEQFFPLSVDNYITIHPYTKPAKTYDYWQEVVDIIHPILSAKGISIVQIGAKDEQPLRGCYTTQGQTTLNSMAYVIKNSLLHLGVDSCSAHFAGHYDKKMVALYSSSYVDTCKPYWGNPQNQRLIQADLMGKKPSFSFSESPKTINRIKPNEIAKHVCELLGLEYNFNLKYIRLGEAYNEVSLDFVPDALISQYSVNVGGIKIRMDYKYDENFLVENLKLKEASIVTNREINPSILSAFKTKIKQIVYILEKDNNPDFVKNTARNGIPTLLTSYLSQKEINSFKINYMDCGIIAPQNPARKEHYDFSSTPNLFYKSNRFILSAGKVFPSKAAFENGLASNFYGPTISPVIDTPSFWEEVKYFCILSK